MWLVFFPQEDSVRLTALQSNLTPFLKALTKALSIELEENVEYERKEALFDEVLRNVQDENSTSNIFQGHPSDILQREFDELLDLQ